VAGNPEFLQNLERHCCERGAWMESSFLYQIEKFVVHALSGAHERIWPFHNIHHVRLVARKCQELAHIYKLHQTQEDELIIAAWFHDIGYMFGSEAHESMSSTICQRFLRVYDWDPASAQKIGLLILATRYPSHPMTLQQQILCDADLYHLASEQYTQWANKLYKEINEQRGETMSKRDWLKTNINFVRCHTYFTDYAIQYWEPLKLKNLDELKRKAGVAE
jgi:predicted metal-dependent HD superfamily phosphohydrolase